MYIRPYAFSTCEPDEKKVGGSGMGRWPGLPQQSSESQGLVSYPEHALEPGHTIPGHVASSMLWAPARIPRPRRPRRNR